MLYIRDFKRNNVSRLKSWKKTWLRRLFGNCAVLLYHRVSRYKTDPQLLCVTPEHFDEQIEFIKKKYKLLDILDFKNHILKKKKFPENSVVITFDDGYADNYLEALPILEKHKVQALFYICTGNIGTDREFWWDEVERLVLLSGIFSNEIQMTIQNSLYTLNSGIESRKKFYDDLLPILRSMIPDERNKVINELTLQVGKSAPRPGHRSMTWDELKSMSLSSSAVIGAHSHRHPSLAVLSAAEQIREIRQSKTLLEANLAMQIRHFSYPFGTRRDYTAITRRICMEEKFELVSANFPKLVNAQTDPFQLPRFLVRDWEIDQFQEKIKEFLN